MEKQANIESGSRIQFRSRKDILNQKAQMTGEYPNTWFLKGTVLNTMKVQARPDSAVTKCRNWG